MDKIVDELLKKIKALEEQVYSYETSQDFEAIKQQFLNIIEAQFEPVITHFK
jgi:hypothetical protein